jgi:hypothetical protein
MRILYWARHNQRLTSNDDEGAITHGLQALGHVVECIPENDTPQRKGSWDFLLFHHSRNLQALRRTSIPKVFWCFDRFDIGDPTLAARTRTRLEWGKQAVALAAIGFCTDGDYVRLPEHVGRLVDLKQGADGRVLGRLLGVEKDIDILFVGTQGHGTIREEFVDMMIARYGSRFVHVAKGVYREDLKHLVARAKIVVAPDFPVSHHYWSNRVYMMLGFGAFLLHPYCHDLAKQYDHGSHLMFYHNREDLHEQIDTFLTMDSQRSVIGRWAVTHTAAHHTYRDRCAVLLDHVANIL